jgi:hypothetical protein
VFGITEDKGNVEVKTTPLPIREDVKTDWIQTIKGNSFSWNGKDLFLTERDGNKVGILSKIANNYCRIRQVGEEKDCYCGNFIRPVSVVGSIVGIDHTSNFSCQGSYYSWRYASFDIEKSGDYNYITTDAENSSEPFRLPDGKLLSLTELFSEPDVFNMLMRNQIIANSINEAINSKKISVKPNNLKELSSFFRLPTTRLLDDFQLEKDYLTRFVFHHIQDERVAVWISLTPSSHVGQANQEHIEILLPISDNLRESFLRAEIKESGFLMKDADKTVGTAYAEFDVGEQ